MLLTDKKLFEELCAPHESLSHWLYIAGLERAQRMKEAAAATEPRRPEPVAPPPTAAAPPMPQPTKKTKRRKRH
jgi:hypothetical protein